jgi:DNA invertase Pin-like site-specific DNA recombinase
MSDPPHDLITTVDALGTAPSTGVWGYCRVSTDGQEAGQSFDVQQADIVKYCATAGLAAPTLVLETGSAGKPLFPISLPGVTVDYDVAPRPLFIALIARLVDQALMGGHLVLWKLDRMARIATEQDMLLSMLRRRSVRVHSTLPGEQDLLDWSKSHDDPVRQLMRTMLGALAEYERAIIRLRTIAGARMKAAKGGWVGGRAPSGYLHAGKEIVIDPVVAEQIRRIFYLRESCGWSMPSIAADLGPPWHKVRVRRVLQNRQLYLGTYTDPHGVDHARPDLRILPDGWGDQIDAGFLEGLDDAS